MSSVVACVNDVVVLLLSGGSHDHDEFGRSKSAAAVETESQIWICTLQNPTPNYCFGFQAISSVVRESSSLDNRSGGFQAVRGFLANILS